MSASQSGECISQCDGREDLDNVATRRLMIWLACAVVAITVIGTGIGAGIDLRKGERTDVGDGTNPNATTSPRASICVQGTLGLLPELIVECTCQGEITTAFDDKFLDCFFGLQSRLRHIPKVYTSHDLKTCVPEELAFIWLANDTLHTGITDLTRLENRLFLAASYLSWAGNQPNRIDSWLTPISECDWPGVMCDSANEIVGLNLTGVDFGREVGLPQGVFDLTLLRKS
jgi:hypothetical protein